MYKSSKKLNECHQIKKLFPIYYQEMTSNTNTPQNYYEKNQGQIKNSPQNVMKEVLDQKETRMLKFSKSDNLERVIFKSFNQPPQFSEAE